MSNSRNGRPAQPSASLEQDDPRSWEWPAIPLRRRIANAAFWIGCFVCLAGVITPALWFSIAVVARALPHFQWNVLTTRTTGIGGGLQNALLGTLAITLGVLIIAGKISLLTGLYLSETAPLLYTANWSAANPSGALTHSPVGYLTYLVFAFSPLNQPYQSANDLSYDAALILFVVVLLVIIVGRVITAISRRHAE